MRKFNRESWLSDKWPILIIAVCFIMGGLWGGFFSAFSSENNALELLSYLTDYMTVVSQDKIDNSLFDALWSQGRWFGVCLLFSLSGVGIVGVPMLFVLRGFLVTFGIGCFFRCFGGAGLVPATLVFGVPGIFWAPGLFLLGKLCMQGSMRVLGAHHRENLTLPRRSRDFRTGVAVSGLLLFLCAIYEHVFLPLLLSAAAEILG